MKENLLKLNLQLFATAGSLVNTGAGYASNDDGSVETFTPGTSDLGPLNKVFYETELLDNARDQLIFAQLGKKQPLPDNKGRTIEWRRWQTLGRVSQLTEGIIPTGKKLSMVAMTATLTQWGDYVAISDLEIKHAIDNVVAGAVQELGAAAGETYDTLVRNVLLGGTNIIFADATNKSTGAYVSTPSTEAGLQTALATYNCNLTVRLINKATTNLKKGAKLKKYAGNYYVAVIHPSVTEDLRNDSAWIDAHKYMAAEEIFTGEIGRMHGVRFVESNLAPVIKSNGQSYATYKTLFFAKDAFGVLDVEAGGIESIIKDKKEVGGPLEQFGTVGVKFEMAAKILYQERMVAVWSGSSYSSDDADNIAA